MSRPLLPLFALLLGACHAQAPVGVTVGEPPARPAELVVAFQPGATGAQRDALRLAYATGPAIPLTPDAEWWPVAAGTREALQAAPGVRFAEPNRRRALPALATTPPHVGFSLAQAAGDPLAQRQWHLDLVGFPTAWETTTGEGVIVAVIDSGVDTQHPDLAAHLLPLIDEITAFKRHDRRNGTTYDGRDGNGHGTHVAGLVGAIRGNGQGVTGGAPDVRILPVKVTAWDGETDDATIAKGITDAVNQGARVLNLSIGGPEPSLILLEALNYAFKRDATVVIAAGNDGGLVNYPAAYAGVISVGAETASGEVASYSSRGDNLVLLAPGGGSMTGSDAILSTVPTYECALSAQGKARDYATLAGTSMASPLASALAALVIAQNPALTAPQVRTRLAASCRDLLTPGWDADSGWGGINAVSALKP